MEWHPLQQFIEQVPAAIAILDHELRYRAVSRRHLSNLAWLFSTEPFASDEVIGRTFFEVSPELPPRWRDALSRVLAGEELAQDEDFVPRQDGRSAWLRWELKPWRDAHRRIGGVLLFGEVITQQVEIRHALAESELRAWRAEERVHLLLREMNHRGKNMLTLVQAIARQTAASDTEQFIERFSDRLQALAASQDLLIQSQSKSVQMHDLARAQLAHFSDLIGRRVSVTGPQLPLSGAATQAIGMALHELATNASKYGALSTDAGQVDIGWRVDGDLFEMHWTERNGPPVQRPKRRGFGSTVVEEMVKRAVDGDVQLRYDPGGLAWRLTCPTAKAIEPH